MSLYDVVHAPQPRKRDRKLHILIVIGLILVLAAFIPIPWAMHLQRQYRHFINGLGESVQYAKEQGGLYVRQDGRQFWSQDSASRLYLELNTAGMGKRQNSAPQVRAGCGAGVRQRVHPAPVGAGRLGRVQPRMGPRRVRLVPGSQRKNLYV